MASEKKSLAIIDALLQPGETITSSIETVFMVSNSSRLNPHGVLALTQQRLIFAGTAGSSSHLHQHPLATLNDVEYEKGIVQHLIRLTLPDADAVTASGALPEPGSVDQVAYRVQSRRAQDFVAAALRASGQVAARAGSNAGGAGSGAGTGSGAAASNGAEAQPDHQLSTADELAKLADLHERGLLSAEEFATAKAKVLE